MRLRLIKILLIIVLPLAGSYLFYHKAGFFYKEPNSFRDKMEYLYDGAGPKDVLFLGSSRVLRHIDPRVVDSICHVDSYNLGVEGMNIPELRMMLRVCIGRGKAPKVLVLNIDPSNLQTEQVFFDLPDLLDYAARDTVVYHAMAEVQCIYRDRWKYQCYRLQRYAAINDGFKVDALSEGEEKFHRRIVALWGDTVAGGGYKGYRPKCEDYHEPKMPSFRVPWQTRGFGLLRDVIHTCRENDIKVVLVTAPMYKDYGSLFENADSLAAGIAMLAREENVVYFNRMRDSVSMDKANFINIDHLNCRGAALYSAELAALLRRLGVSVLKK